VNGATFDLGLGTDTILLNTAGGTLTAANVEVVTGDAGDDVVTLQGPITGATVDLGAGTADVLQTIGNTTVTVSNAET
ncbi:hypothetical protein J8J27_35260, partial [Mycobacterium tuberculosis]|nr:hypothetical protein [Mycobacterium tuberculosis]